MGCLLAVSLIAAACTDTKGGMASGRLLAPVADSEPDGAAPQTLRPDAVADRPDGVDRDSGEQSAQTLMSDSVGPPFGRADYYSGTGAVRDGLWVTLGPNDVPGPLWHASLGLRPRRVGQVFDACVLEEAWVIAYGHEPIDGVPGWFYSEWRDLHPGCLTIDDPDHEPFGRWSYVGETGSLSYLRTKAEAFAEGREYEQRLRPDGELLPWNANLLGIVKAGNTELIGFRDAGYAAQPVEVLPESISYDAGTLRGLVRNWSPTRFAYGVQVSVGDAQWQWPLSIQPGEIAPFELTGLSLAHSPPIEELMVVAQMRDEADISRAFDFRCSPPWFEGNADDLEFDVPGIVHDTLPRQGRHLLAFYCADVNRYISSRPDWQDDQQPVTVENLRSYVAFMEYDGTVLDIRELVIFTEYYPDEPGAKIIKEVITGIPNERVIAGETHRSSRARLSFAAASGEDHLPANWIVWIGGAHNSDTEDS